MAKKSSISKKRNKKTSLAEDSIEVTKVEQGSAVAAGRGARALVINLFGGYWQLVVLALFTAILLSGYFLWQVFFPEKMTGDFRVAVADFAIIGNPPDANAGTELAEGVYLKLNESLSEINKDFTVTVWSPDKVGKVEGDTPEDRALSAEKIAERIGADVLIYGLIDMTKPVWIITPEFYIASDNFYEAEEITGQHQIGEPFLLIGQDEIARRIELTSKFDIRARAMSIITIGLAYYSLRDYSRAFEVFQTAENIPEWDDSQGKEVLYVLAGNSAAKAKKYDIAIIYLNKALTVNPDYGRPLLSLGNVYYLQSLVPFDKTKNIDDIDLGLIGRAIETYNQALQAKDLPALSDVPTKVHFGLGQCYLMQVYAGEKTFLNEAVDEFQLVIQEYGNGNNPRLRELAAEAHARLGLIYDLSGYSVDAVREYEQAASLLFDNPDRQQQYHDRAAKIEANISSTP